YFAPLEFPQTVEGGLRVASTGTSSVRYEIGLFAPGAPLTAARARATGTITLLTGDRVTVRLEGDQLFPSVVAGPGRGHVGFDVRRSADQITVLPSDVVPLITAGRLDPELFNVTRLLAQGLGDDQRDDLPLLVTQQADLAAAHQRMAAIAGVRVDRALPALHTLAVRQRKANPGAVLASAAAGKIWLDRQRKVTLDHSVPQIGAPAAYARGFTGAGVAIAVLDSGIDASHPDFANKIVAAEDFVGDGNGTNDVFGHGTHVASILAGSGAASGGQFHGVAIDATLINGRVCGAAGTCSDSAVLAGMEWAAETQHARIVNMSLGSPDTADVDPLEDAVNTLSAQFGTLFVIAAGNDGVDQSIESPGSADAALTVGAVDVDNQLAFFSSRGPRTGDHALKPDLTGPGVNITAARAAGSTLGPAVGDRYMILSGTSMATPHVAGAAALLLQQHPTWTGAQLKDALINTAQPTAGLTVYQQGAGRVDIDRATRHAVSADPGSESFGVIPFPHDHDAPSVRTVTYHNDGAAPVTLTLAAALTAKDGPAAAGAVTVSPATLTIATGATATATVAIDTRLDGPLGLYGGALTATGDDLRIVTPLAIEREAELFNLTVNSLGVDGTEHTVLMSFEPVAPPGDPRRNGFVLRQTHGATTFRLPAGTYMVTSSDSLSANATLMIAPRVDLTSHDVTVLFDGQLARPFKVDLPHKAVSLVNNTVDYEDVENLVSSFTSTFNPLFTAQIGPGPAPGKSHSYVQLIYASRPDRAPTDVYNLAHEEQDHLLAGWTQSFRAADFADVDVTVAGRENRDYFKQEGAVCPDHCANVIQGVGYAGPFEHTEHYFGPRFRWDTILLEANPHDFESSTSEITAQEDFTGHEGQTLTQTWNQAVFGPAFAGPSFANQFGRPDNAPVRTADGILHLAPSMFADAAGREGDSADDGSIGTATLFENGAQIAQQTEGFFPLQLRAAVGRDDADFELRADFARPAELDPLSSHVTATWSFHSAPSADGSDEFLALPVMRFTPALNQHNRTGATVLPLPIAIDRPPHAATPKIKAVTLDVSFDDGVTWQAVPVALDGAQALALIVHPPGTTFVSLHGTVTDARGNAVDQTILHAYQLKQPHDPAD
ncbi:MAG TPA: S8 family peptidase, partial [Kofleriaceae bacterium]|nr:S8 family peptidase [Kofleriaceae bacterium]